MKRIQSFDLIRCVATFCIITFHFMVGNEHIYPEKYFFRNYDVAQVGVSLFFILSGAALYYNEKKNFSIKLYYKKRFLAIFPMYWMAYISIFFYIFWIQGYITSEVPTRNLIFSVFALDGLLGYKFSCLCLTGEWFLGCILFIYLAYPLVHYGIKKMPILTMILYTIIYIGLYFNYRFELSILYNPIIRGLEFVFGMFYIEILQRKNLEWKDSFDGWRFGIGLILSLIILYAPLDIVPQMWLITIGGGCIFVTLMEAGKLIKNKNMLLCIKTGSKYSYAVFLVHHIIAGRVMDHFSSGYQRRLEIVAVYIIYLLLVFLFAKILHVVYAKVMRFFYMIKAKEQEDNNG